MGNETIIEYNQTSIELLSMCKTMSLDFDEKHRWGRTFIVSISFLVNLDKLETFPHGVCVIWMIFHLSLFFLREDLVNICEH